MLRGIFSNMRALIAALSLAACGTSHGPDAGGSLYGEACSAELPCTGGLSCVTDARFPGGYCTRLCESEGCPGEADCDDRIEPSLCLARCAEPSECRAGYQCWGGNCRPACGADADCEGGVCEAGHCAEPGPDGGMRLAEGAACAIDAQCATDICLPPELGGVCTIACEQPSECVFVSFSAGCAPVASGGEVRTLCAMSAGRGRVGEACGADSDCRSRVCLDGQCTGVCADESDCEPGQLCTTIPLGSGSFLGCGYSPGPAGIAIEEIDLGETELAAGVSTDFALAIPPDAVSVTLQSQVASGDPLELTFITVTSPDATRIFDVDEIAALRDTPERWLPIDTGESITMLVPNTTADRLVFGGGLYRWSVSPFARMAGDTGRIRLRSRAIVKRSASRTVAGGSLDLNVFLVGVGINAASATSNARLQGTLSTLSAILSAEAGISVRDVQYIDITGADATRLSVIDSSDGPGSELAQLFRASAGRTGRRLNVFLVRSINGEDGGFQALGIAGGIPGPVGLHGTMHSGVVAAFDPGIIETGSMGGHILAHEIAHYLGLYHATEQRRPCGPGETPSTGACLPFGAGDTLADTTRGDDENLMYWSVVGSGSNRDLSAGQAFVLRMSALVQP